MTVVMFLHTEVVFCILFCVAVCCAVCVFVLCCGLERFPHAHGFELPVA
jgi:hypothetical protein